MKQTFLLLCLICHVFAYGFYPVDGNKRYQTVLTIAGSDCSGGAGIQADIKTFTLLNCYGMSALTALTAQNTVGVKAIQPLYPEFVEAQLESIMGDISIDCVKIGMLEREEIVTVVANFLKRNTAPVVVDPVMFAKSGDQLIDDAAVAALKKEILPLATVLTPNEHEACRLLGIPLLTTDAERERAAVRLLGYGPQAVVLKGRHGRDCFVQKGEEQIHWLEGAFIETKNIHGTGCTFSAAIAAYLAKEYAIPAAVKRGKNYITKAIARGADYCLGHGQGPVCHAHMLGSKFQFTQEVWWEAQSLFSQIRHHPFLLELESGRLPSKQFLSYLQQDYLFLIERSKALKFLSQRAPSRELQVYLEELSVGSMEGAENISSYYHLEAFHPERLEKNRACQAYTDEMIRLAQNAPFEQAVAFFLPCALTYQKLGEDFHSSCGSDHPYRLWIEKYSRPDRRERVSKLIDLVDQLATDVSGVELEEMRQTFLKAMEYERDFWEGSYYIAGEPSAFLNFITVLR